MESNLKQAYDLLKVYREREDLSLKPCKYLRDEFEPYPGANPVPFGLRYYQVIGVLHLMTMRRFILGDDTGLGKTATTIASLCYLWERQPNLKAVVLTTKSAVNQWAGEFKKFTTGIRVVTVDGSPKKRDEIYEWFKAQTEPTVLVTNYAKVRVDFDEFHTWDWENIVFVNDECTAYKSTKSQIHKKCKYIAERANRVWGLTATLIKNNLEEGYAIYKVVVPDLFTSKQSFYDNFCVIHMQPIPGGRKVPIVKGHTRQHVASFKQVIDPFYIGRPKHLVAKDLPTLVSRQLLLKMNRGQEALYQDALDGLLAIDIPEDVEDEYYTDPDEFDEEDASHLSALIRCQQVANHPELVEESGKSAKLEQFLELLTEGDLVDEKVIVFTRFKKMVDILEPILNKKFNSDTFCVRVTGAENGEQREEAKVRFQNPTSDTKVICITMAGSDAINLQAAKAIVFYDTPWSAGDYLQILGRMIRIGSTHDSVYALHLVCEGTIDQHVMGTITSKMKVVEGALGKRIKGEDGDDDSDFTVKSQRVYMDLYDKLRADSEKRNSK